MTIRDTNETFIAKAIAVHGDRYDYSSVNYINSTIKVDIVCREHGVFSQKPGNHINLKHNCPKCSGKCPKQSEQIFMNAIRIRGFKANSEYQGNNKKVSVSCPNNHTWFITPADFKSGYGCPHCSGTVRGDNDSFIKSARVIHGDTYDYSKVEYVNNTTHVNIICHTHGEFKQTPKLHKKGSGCPSCSVSGFKPLNDSFLYILRSTCGQYLKVGITNKPDDRFTVLKCRTPFEFEVIECFKVYNGEVCFNVELMLKRTYSKAGFTGFNGATEWFYYDCEIINTCKSLLT